MRPEIGILLFALLLVLMAAFLVAITMASRYKLRELQHRERMAALEKGGALPPLDEPVQRPAPFDPRTLKLRGLLWLFTGIAITVFLTGMVMTARQRPAWVRVDEASRARNNGASDSQILQIMNDRRTEGPNAGIALIGLIPIGVGLAYLITWRSERRT